MTRPVGRRGNLELILDWIAALRSGETDAIADLLDPDVVWHGVSGDLVCVGRAEVVDVLGEQVPLRIDVDALELICAPGRVVVGTRSDQLPEPPGVDLGGQIYNVIERRDCRFVAIRDFARRGEALEAAGLAGVTPWR